MRYLLFIALILIVPKLWAQEAMEEQHFFRVGLSGNYNTFSQKDLKFINQSSITDLPFDAQILDEFKPSFGFGAYAQYRLFNHFFIGPEYHYYYTGSRLGQKDYSGQYSFDQYLQAHSVGLKMDFDSYQTKLLCLFVELSAGSNFTNWKMDSELVISEETDGEVDKVNGYGLYVNPALGVKYRLFQRISLWGSAGYSFDAVKKYKYKSNPDLKIVKKPDWSGLRLSVGIEYEI